MQSLWLTAHAADTHPSAWASFWHSLDDWQTGVPFFVILLPAIVVIFHLLVRHNAKATFGLTAGMLLVVGLLAYPYATAVSAVAFSLGVLALIACLLHILFIKSSADTKPADGSPPGKPTRNKPTD